MARTKKDIHFVYLLKDGDSIVYVGCTRNLIQRMNGHKNKPHNNVEIRKFNCKNEAMFWERQLIIYYLPKYNFIANHIKQNRDQYMVYNNALDFYKIK